MRSPITFLIATFFSINLSAQQYNEKTEEIIKLPIELINSDYFNSPNALLTENQYHNKALIEEVKGVPESWEKPIIDIIIFDYNQFYYQNYKKGYITKSEALDMLEDPSDTLRLSEKPIKAYTHIVFHQLQDGAYEYILDTDNDLDFSNDDISTPFEILIGEKYSENDKQKFVQLLKGELWVNNKMKVYNFPYLVQKFKDNLTGKFIHYGRTLYKNDTIFLNTDGEATFDFNARLTINQKPNEVKIGEYFVAGDETLQFLGADFKTQTLKLKKINKDFYSLSGPQVGLKALPFNEKDFRTGEEINLNDYKGKLLYIDFWATWCRGCIEDMPELINIYNSLDHNQVEFLGVNVDEAERLEDFFNVHDLPWKQINTNINNGNLVKKYNVKNYPTSFLIDEDGTIIGRDIRPHALRKAILKYKNKKEALVRE